MVYARSFERLVRILEELREKCPWDKKQTIHTLRSQSIEELYELADAISEENWQGIKEELGDLLLHIVFYSKLGSEQGKFDIGDVIAGVCDKLVQRHPHIYEHTVADDADAVKQNWEKIKLKEGRKSVLSGVPNGLPALVKALRLQEKSKQVGFEWSDTVQVYDKVTEELEELQEAIASGTPQEVEEEFGDVLFSLINYARFLQVDPEHALEMTNKKFLQRFQQMETYVVATGRNLQDLTLEQMDAIWTEVKLKNRSQQ